MTEILLKVTLGKEQERHYVQTDMGALLTVNLQPSAPTQGGGLYCAGCKAARPQRVRVNELVRLG